MISVIIPALNEEQTLPALLAGLHEEETAHEVIVVDGGSADAPARLARDHGASIDALRELLPVWKFLVRARTAHELDLGELEAVAGRCQRAQALIVVRGSREEHAEAATGPTPDAAAELVELAEPEAVGVLHDHDRGLGHVDAHLDDRGGDEDVEIATVSPPFVADAMESGEIDGACVGEPWNQQAVFKGIGVPVVTDYEIWKNNPEKVFGVSKK